MFASARSRISFVGLAACMALAACASPELVNHASRPGKFRLYNCQQLDTRGGELFKRERELDALIQKARQGGAGGEVAIALAYQTEYTTVLGDLREVELSGAERNCVLKYKTMPPPEKPAR